MSVSRPAARNAACILQLSMVWFCDVLPPLCNARAEEFCVSVACNKAFAWYI